MKAVNLSPGICLEGRKRMSEKYSNMIEKENKGRHIGSAEELTSKTISDFGEQCVNYRGNPGYYSSVEMLKDHFGPLLALDAVRGKRVADIGSGTGRIVNMLLDAGAAHVIAVEPSAAFSVLQANTAKRSDRVTYIINGRGDALPSNLSLDLVVSIGVLHHIPEPDPVVEAAFHALRPGGHMLVWLYGRESNEMYLRFAVLLRAVTKRIPHILLIAICTILNVTLDLYIFGCRLLPLPMRSYMRNVLSRFPRSVRKLTIYDQLNPAYAKYFYKNEAESLLRRAGFAAVSSWHRHGYSWSVVGQKTSDV